GDARLLPKRLEGALPLPVARESEDDRRRSRQHRSQSEGVDGGLPPEFLPPAGQRSGGSGSQRLSLQVTSKVFREGPGVRVAAAGILLERLLRDRPQVSCEARGIVARDPLVDRVRRL